jgi:acyl dehydratase
MSIDRRHIGYRTAPSDITIDAWRVKLFCQAIGETDEVHWNPEAARAAGHRGCPVPPTFLKAVEGEHFSSAALMALLGVPVARVLHAEQRFEHCAPLCVGDTVTVSRVVADIYDKKDGALSFIVVDSVYGVNVEPVASSRQTILVRNPQEAR